MFQLEHKRVVSCYRFLVPYLDQGGERRTMVRVIGHGFTADEESLKMRAFLGKRSRTTLNQAADHCAVAAWK